MKPSEFNIELNEDLLKELDLDDLYKSLKDKGVEIETQVNETIQESISNNKLIELSSLVTPFLTQLITKLKENSEVFSSLMNIPTKDDLASTTKLVIETQEKMDALEEQNWQLIDLNKKLLDMLSQTSEWTARMEKLEKERLINDIISEISWDIKG
ncbi:hypothetical protein [Virgibacillus siamensis]|uniref:hypothetical protein n=1 Tax=Virgibacillus siamensis TaxID=480071 RepID=UPI000984B513|nr:hypothetical protein [Virgibacillus siamensis]